MRQVRKIRSDRNQRQILHDSLWRLEDGFSLAVITAVIALITALLTALGVAISIAQLEVRTQLVADAAALVAADTLIGAVAGFPCENAELIASADGAFLSSCRIVGLGAVVTTTNSLGFFGVELRAEASAQRQ